MDWKVTFVLVMTEQTQECATTLLPLNLSLPSLNRTLQLWCVIIQVLKPEASQQSLLGISEVVAPSFLDAPQKLVCKQLFHLLSHGWLYSW